MKLPRQINKLLQSKNSRVAALITEARKLEYLNNILLDLLPSPLPHHCHLAKMNGNKLVIVVDSPTWSARLRYSIPELLAKLKHHSQFFIPIKNIEIKVNPQWQSKPNHVALKPKRISSGTSKCLKETANSIENEAIKKALLKLASHS